MPQRHLQPSKMTARGRTQPTRDRPYLVPLLRNDNLKLLTLQRHHRYSGKAVYEVASVAEEGGDIEAALLQLDIQLPLL
jgi:hypothetical protein